MAKQNTLKIINGFILVKISYNQQEKTKEGQYSTQYTQRNNIVTQESNVKEKEKQESIPQYTHNTEHF